MIGEKKMKHRAKKGLKRESTIEKGDSYDVHTFLFILGQEKQKVKRKMTSSQQRFAVQRVNNVQKAANALFQGGIISLPVAPCFSISFGQSCEEYQLLVA